MASSRNYWNNTIKFFNINLMKTNHQGYLSAYVKPEIETILLELGEVIAASTEQVESSQLQSWELGNSNWF